MCGDFPLMSGSATMSITGMRISSGNARKIHSSGNDGSVMGLPLE